MAKADRTFDADADPEVAARALCLRLLAARPRTRAELAAALARRGVPDGAAERVLDRLAGVRLVDDAAFAESWLAGRSRRNLSRAALGAGLRQRGVGAADVAAALSEPDDAAERARARELVARRAPSLAGLDRRTRERRLAGLLARRGYPADLVGAVVREVLDAAADGDPVA